VDLDGRDRTWPGRGGEEAVSTGRGTAAGVTDALGVPGRPGLLLCGSRDPDAKLTFLLSGPDAAHRFAVKVPVTARAAQVLDDEGRALVALRCLDLGPLAPTVPRYVRSTVVAGRAALVSCSLPGTAMTVRYHSWRHTARRPRVREDLDVAARWLADFQSATTAGTSMITWPADTAAALARRWPDHPQRDRATSHLQLAQRHMTGLQAPITFVHGDFWFGNLLVHDGRVSGCVDWEAASAQGCPLRDLARFALSYALYLDRHARPGARVPGHRGLRRAGFGAGITHVLRTDTWIARDLRRFLGDGLERLGLPRALWYDVALTGIAEVAASANDDEFAQHHLELLASLPSRPRGRGQR
jgi:aminoglycoside phosphotransferase (APT) family kinase protein